MKSPIKPLGVIFFLCLPLSLIVACGGGSSPEDEVAGVAKDHLVAITEFDAGGICGPMSSEAEEEFADAADDDEEWDTATESAYCEYLTEGAREEYEDAEGSEKDTAVLVYETLRETEMDQVSIDPDGISATATSKPFSVEVDGEELSAQVWYSLSKEDGSWLVNEAIIFEKGEDPEDGEGTTIFPD